MAGGAPGPVRLSGPPPGQPVIFQAGNSDQGRDLGAAIGEGIQSLAEP